jgi:hypothetical protein
MSTCSPSLALISYRPLESVSVLTREPFTLTDTPSKTFLLAASVTVPDMVITSAPMNAEAIKIRSTAKSFVSGFMEWVFIIEMAAERSFHKCH